MLCSQNLCHTAYILTCEPSSIIGDSASTVPSRMFICVRQEESLVQHDPEAGFGSNFDIEILIKYMQMTLSIKIGSID